MEPRSGLSQQTMQLMWQEASRSPVLLWTALIAPVLTVLVSQFAGPLVIANILERIQVGDVTWSSTWPLVVLYALTQFAGEVVGWRIALYAAWNFQVQGQQHIFERVFGHLNLQSMAFHADRFSGSLVSATNKLVGAFETFWDTITWMLLPILTTIVAAVVILAFVLWWYALFLAGMAAVFILLVVQTRRVMEPLNVAEASASNTMTGFLADVMTNIGAVKAQGSERREQIGAERVALVWRDRSLGVMRPFLRYSAGFATVSVILNTGAVLAAIWAADQAVISIGAVYLALTYTMTVTQQLWEINQVMRNYNQVMGDCHDMVEILELPATVADRSGTPFRPGPGAIDIEQMRFGHETQHVDPLFDDFSLHIAAGERIGLVGHSGSGKTTLTRLLLRFADVDAGRIMIDGQDVRDVTQASLREAIAYVPQEPLLFHRSLAENIGYGHPGATIEEIREAAAKAYALDFIEALPEGFATPVGERGVKLSGGQRQRVAIARAVLKDAPILVLDEATSALDSESELHIQAALGEAMQGRTTVVIAHRLSTVQLMDRIVVLDRGSIVEQGTHAELLAGGGHYATLWAHQSGGFLRAE